MKTTLKLRKPAAKLSLSFLKGMLLIAFLASALANDKPLFLIQNGTWSLPFLNETKEIKLAEADYYLPAPIPYGESTIDYKHSGFYSPFAEQHYSNWHQRHWLGTDGLGRDVLAQLIYGCQTAVWVGLGAVSLALLLGLLIGGLSALVGDNSLHFSRLRIFVIGLISLGSLLLIISLPPYHTPSASIQEVITIVCLSLLFSFSCLIFADWILKKWEKKRVISKSSFALDLYLNRFIEVIDSLPIILLILAMSALVKGGLTGLILVIGFTSWTGIAKMFRAEILKAKEEAYVESGKALGFSKMRLLFKHMLPNAIPPILVSASFGIAAVILIEASFSFLGLGLSAEEASWGSMIASARQNFDAWWLAVFPGLAIFFTLFACNKVGDALSTIK